MNKKFRYCYDIVSYFNFATLLLSLPREASPRASIATPSMAIPINNFSPKKGSIPFTGYGLEVTAFSLPCDAWFTTIEPKYNPPIKPITNKIAPATIRAFAFLLMYKRVSMIPAIGLRFLLPLSFITSTLYYKWIT
jgi:hypothetical protein